MSDETTASSVPTGQGPTLRQDVGTALRNSVQLGVSLLATWGVALLVRFFLPRQLGPERFGLYTFADNLAAAMLGLLSFGVDSYIQKEIPVRPRHASDFFAGIAVSRSVLACVAIAVVSGILHLTGRSTEMLVVVAVFGLGYTLFTINSSLAALLQANMTIGGLAVANPAAKLVWGVAVALCLIVRAPLAILASAFALSELLRALALVGVVRRQLDLKLRIDLRATRAVVLASLPYYLNSLVLALNMRLDVTIMGFVVHDNATIGWYSAAANLAGLSLIMVPLFGSILMPLLSRSFRRSPDEFWLVVRRALEALQAATLPITLFLALGADVWIEIVFGGAFGPSTASLRVLSAQFVFTYVAMLLSLTLIVLGRGWSLARISLFGLVLHPVISVFFITIGRARAGAVGAGIGAALGALGMEIAVTVLLFANLGRATFDGQNLRTLWRSLLTCALVAVIFGLAAPLGHLRLVLCALSYPALALALGALRLPQVLAFARKLRQARG